MYIFPHEKMDSMEKIRRIQTKFTVNLPRRKSGGEGCLIPPFFMNNIISGNDKRMDFPGNTWKIRHLMLYFKKTGGTMLNYTIRTDEMSHIMGLLSQVLDIPITFFDANDTEIDTLHFKEMSPFCRESRKEPAFFARCRRCDREHLGIAKRQRSVHIYRCHAGLLETIVPLEDRHGAYLGAIVCGQLAPPEKPLPGVRSLSQEEMRNIGALLKYLCEYICENELVRRCALPWSVQFDEYCDAHIGEKISLKLLARHLGKSPSFLTHNIPAEFGMPFKKYLRRKKMRAALELLRREKQVRECAFELGYSDEFYFSRDFKRYYGVPPKQWRIAAVPHAEAEGRPS